MNRIVHFALPACGLAAALALAAGCSSPTVAAAPAPAVTATHAAKPASPCPASWFPSVPSHMTAVQADAVDAYCGMLADWVTAGAIIEYNDPILMHHLSGSALTKVWNSLFVEQNEGAVDHGAPLVTDITFGQEVPAAAPTQVEVDSCLDDSSWLEYTKSGKLFNDVPGGRHDTQIMAQDENGTWKIDQLVMNPVGSC